MSNSEQNWRPQVTAEDFLQQSEKRLQFESRRPRLNRAADLVGPGISAYTRRLDDFDDDLATYDGYFSALADAANGPVAADLTGFVSSDEFFGGIQTFWTVDCEDGPTVYNRSFCRAPDDPTIITYSDWVEGAGGGGTPDDTGWIDATLENSWTNDGFPYANTRYRRTGGIVYLGGAAVPGSLTDTIFTLPIEFRPDFDLRLVVQVDARRTSNQIAPSSPTAHTHDVQVASTVCHILTTGEVSIESTIATWVSFETLLFVVDGAEAGGIGPPGPPGPPGGPSVPEFLTVAIASTGNLAQVLGAVEAPQTETIEVFWDGIELEPTTYSYDSGTDTLTITDPGWHVGDLVWIRWYETSPSLVGANGTNGEGIAPFSVGGVLAPQIFSMALPITRNCNVQEVIATVGDGSTGAPVVIDILRGTLGGAGPVTLFTAGVNRPSVPAGSGLQYDSGVPALAVLSVGEYLLVQIVSVGSTYAGAHLVVMVVTD